MNQSEDHSSIRQISGIIIGLALITVVILMLVNNRQSESDVDADPSRKILSEKNISPVGGVRVGADGAAALAAAQAAAAAAPAEDAVVEDAVAEDAVAEDAVAEDVVAEDVVAEDVVAEVDGEQVYGGLCMSCHEAGVADAPLPGSDQMAQLLSEKGMDTLVTNVINGFNVMPPRGGNADLTDEQIRAAVDFMLP